jgi:hypothetical protein
MPYHAILLLSEQIQVNHFTKEEEFLLHSLAISNNLGKGHRGWLN